MCQAGRKTLLTHSLTLKIALIAIHSETDLPHCNTVLLGVQLYTIGDVLK